MQKYDVFISYRRDGGDVTAKHLRDALTERGYRVFLDVESLRNGPFNEALYEVIENTKDFLLILPPNGLDRCVNENDWVRLEIEHAKACNRNIVPVMLKGFSFPEELPESIDFVRFQSAPPSLEINFFDAFVDKLQTFLTSRPHPLRKRILTLSVAVLLLCAAGFGLYYCISTYPLKREDKNLVSSLISYTSLNLTRLDLAGDRYIKELDRALSSVEGKTSDSDTKIQYELFEYSKEIREQADMITALPDSLRQQLLQSPFDVGNLDAFKPALVTVMTEYADNLDYIRESLVGNDGLRAEHKAEYIGILKEMAELDAEMLFYQLNESLLPVTNDDALSLLKTEMLPRMTFLYADRLDLTHDKEALMQKEEAIFQQYEKLVSRYEESVERELDNIDTEQIRDQLEMLTNLRELTGADTGELEERLRGILNKTKQLDQARENLMALDKELAEKKQAVYQKFKPLAEDDLPTLWGKGKKFLTMNMPSAAAECFRLYVDKGDADSKAYGSAALRFAETCTELNLEGGVVVCFFEEDLPKQAVQTGDVIFEVAGKPVRNYTEFSNAVSEEGTYPIKLVRFTETGYELLESVFDTSLGRLAILGLTDDNRAEAE